MNPFALSGLLIFVTSAILIIIIVAFGKKKIHLAWAFFNIAVCIWGVGTFMAGKATVGQTALLGWYIGLLGGIFVSPLFYYTVCLLCDIDRKRSIYLILSLTILCDWLILKFGIYHECIFLFGSIYYCKGTIVYRLVWMGWVTVAGISYYELIKFIRHSKGTKRVQTIYFAIGSLFGFIGGASAHLPSLGINIYPYGNYGVAIYSLIGTYAILRHNLLDIRIAISRTGIFLVLYAFILGIPFYVWYRSPTIYSLVLMFLLATIGPFLYRALGKKADNILLKEQRRYQQILLQAANGMAKEHDLNRLLKLVVYIVKRTIKVSFVASFVHNTDEKAYRLKVFRGQTNDAGEEIVLPYEHPLILYLQHKMDPFLVEEMPNALLTALSFPFKPSLIVPSYYEDKLQGFLVLGEKQNQRLYAVDDINVLTIVARQMGLAIENCLFVEEFKKAQERIFSAEKLASIGGMAEGIAHQLVNRLNHFSLNAELIEHKIERFLGKEVSEVENIANIRTVFNDLSKIACTQTENVRHTHDMLKGILNYATIEVKEQDFCIFALEDIINPALELLKIKHNVNEFPLKIETGGDDGKIYGVKPQLMESLYNVLDNAYEALKEREALAKANGENYTPKIVLRKSVKNGMKVLEVVDNGIGIKDESKGKIFAPFFSTKSTNKSGSGIGMYIVKRMIEEIHKGKISLESEYGTGTAVRIELPGSNER